MLAEPGIRVGEADAPVVAILEWRIEQERKLAQKSSAGSRVMSDAEVARFIGFYERITRHNLRVLPPLADAVLELDAQHGIAASRLAGTVF